VAGGATEHPGRASPSESEPLGTNARGDGVKPGSAYRADIDGLRAVAVVAVLLFHLHVPGFAGGYVGVDVFFVISGYLITGLIRAEMVRETFSLKTFYLRRVRRLAPALLLVTIPTAIAAAILLYPEDMRSFAGSLALQFVSLQNVFFLADGEYFRNADTKLLLHTWTLAVEEQFYLLWPLLLLLTRRLALSRRVVVVVTTMAVSFACNLVFMRLSPKASFFLLPARAWELGAGGLLALVEAEGLLAGRLTRALRSAAAALGLFAIGTAVVTFSADTPFPGTAALLPVAGAVLVVVAGIGGPHGLTRALAHPAMVHVGLISYPMYLWHWPLIAGAHHLHRAPGEPLHALVIVALTFGLAEVTYRFVETPVRDRVWLASGRRLVGVVAVCALTLSALAVHAYVHEGAAYRFRAEARPFLTAPLSAAGERCGLAFRVLHPRGQVCALHAASPARRHVLLWGNSHADMWSGLFVELAREHGASAYLNARNCRATPDSAFCGADVQRGVLTFVRERGITDVVLASTWYGSYDIPDAVFERALDDVTAELAAAGVTTWLVVDIPTAPALDPIAAFEKNRSAPVFGTLDAAAHETKRTRERALFEALAAKHPSVRVIDASPTLCGGGACAGGRSGEAWYRDSNHLTYAGARAVSEHFTPVFAGAARDGR